MDAGWLPPQLTPGLRKHLYTSGNEYLTPTGEIYIGWYHIHPEKGAMVGKVHTSEPHDPLIKMTPDMLSYFNAVRGAPKIAGKVPFVGVHVPFPTTEDFEKGKIKRTFIEKKNEDSIFEVNPKLASKIHGEMGSDLYKLIKIDWYITGPGEFLDNKNKEQIESVSDDTTLLKILLKDYRQFSDSSVAKSKYDKFQVNYKEHAAEETLDETFGGGAAFQLEDPGSGMTIGSPGEVTPPAETGPPPAPDPSASPGGGASY